MLVLRCFGLVHEKCVSPWQHIRHLAVHEKCVSFAFHARFQIKADHTLNQHPFNVYCTSKTLTN